MSGAIEGIRGGGAAGLVSAVIDSAWQDVRMRAAPPGKNSSPTTVTVQERAEALAFLTEVSGPLAERREFFCNLIGICPDRLRERAVWRETILGPAA